MASVQDDTEDSRTSIVGRKRAASDLEPDPAHHFSSDLGHATFKRARGEDEVSNESAVMEEVADDSTSHEEGAWSSPASAEAQTHFQTEVSEIPPSANDTHMDMGIVAESRDQELGNAPIAHANSLSRESDNQQEAISNLTHIPNTETLATQPLQEAAKEELSRDQPGHDISLENEEGNPGPQKTENKRALLPTQSTFNKSSVMLLENTDYDICKDPPSFPIKIRPKQQVWVSRKSTFQLPELLIENKPVAVHELDFPKFIRHFLKSNPSLAAWGEIRNSKSVRHAFTKYVSLYYPAVSQKALSNPDILTFNNQKIVELVNEAKKDLTESLDAPSRSSKANASLSTADALQPSPGTGIPFSKVALENGETSAMQQTDVDKREETIETGLEALEGIELELQQKYFPSVPGHSPVRCLACSGTSHRTFDCPQLSCSSCGGNHSDSRCPQNERCGKCRQKGHSREQCKEKLAASKDETFCDLCNSPRHLEGNCHLIWRTYRVPSPRSIRKVKSIPTSCYVCGDSTHFGPECGLFRGEVLSGGVTWSKKNVLQYIDPNSKNRAVSAGVDYTIPPRKGLSIKGKATDPIMVASSDDEIDFIRPRVDNPPAKRRAQGPGSRGGRESIQTNIRGPPRDPPLPRGPPPRDPPLPRGPPPRDAPPRDPPRPRYPSPGRDSRRYFDRDFGDSARYGREEAFSPPPRFDDYHYGPPEPDSYRASNQIPYRESNFRQSERFPPGPQFTPVNGHQSTGRPRGGGVAKQGQNSSGGKRGRRPARR